MKAPAKLGGDVQNPIETKIHPRRKLRMQSSSQPGSHHRPSRCRAGSGMTRERSSGGTGGRAIGGDPESQPPGAAEGSEDPGRPGELASALPEDRGDRGDLVSLRETQGRIDQRRYRSSEETGRPEDSTTVARKGERIEATRGAVGRLNRKIEEARRRGEPIGRPTGEEDRGRPGASEPVKPRVRE